MSNPTCFKRAGRAAAVLGVGLAFAAVPVAAQASAVGLGTAAPFVVLGGASVTNTGPSVLNGDLGVAPGTSLSGFDTAVVNGATHDNDSVADIAQNDLTTAYNVAAGQAPTANLTGQDLGGLVLTAGAYKFDSSAQLTGALTLDAQGDPNAQFVFEIGSTLTTASASSVVLTNGASPCNVYWQVASSATLGTTTAFKGNLMTLASITLNNGATVQGRALAQRGGSVTLDNNVLDGSMCGTSTTPPPDSTPPGGPTDTGGPTGAGTLPVNQAAPGSRTTLATRRGSATLRRTPGTPASRLGICTDGFSATVRGHMIKKVVFSLDGKRVASRIGSPFRVHVRALTGRHNVRARVTFKDATRAKTLNLGYRACAAAVLRPTRGPSRFTG